MRRKKQDVKEGSGRILPRSKWGTEMTSWTTRSYVVTHAAHNIAASFAGVQYRSIALVGGDKAGSRCAAPIFTK